MFRFFHFLRFLTFHLVKESENIIEVALSYVGI